MSNRYRTGRRLIQRKKANRGNKNILGMILCFILGLIIGAAGLAGGVLGAGGYIFNQPINETVSLVDKYIPADLYGMLFGSDEKDGLLNEKYASMKIVEIIGDTFGAVTDFTKGGSLDSLNEVSPKVGALVEKVLKKAEEYSIPLDKNTVMSTSLKELPKYFTSTLKNAPLGDVLNSFNVGDSALVMAFCYGEEGVDYAIDENGKVVMLGDAKKTTVNDLINGGFTPLLNNAPLDAFLSIDASDPVMCSLAYGSSNRYTVVDGKVQMTQVTYTLANKTGSYRLYDDNDEVVEATINLLSDTLLSATFADGTVQYVTWNTDSPSLAYSDEALTSPVLYKKVKIADLSEDAMSLIDGIYLKDVLNIDAKQHSVLITLAYGTEGVDFKFVGSGDNKTIEMIGDAKPRTIGALRTQGTNLINDVPLSSIVGEDPDNALVMYLLCGREGVHYTVNNGAVVMLQKQIAVVGNTVYNEYGELTTGTLNSANSQYTDANGITYNYVPSSLTLKTEDGKTANVYYLNDLNGNAVMFSKTTLGDMMGEDNALSSLTDRVMLKDILDEETLNGNVFLKYVQNETISSLPNAINNLTIQQIYEDEIFTVVDGKKVVKGEWWYLLHDEATCSANHGSTCDKKCVADYQVAEFGSLISNMRSNVEVATVRQLHNDGMISGLSTTTLNSKVKTKVGNIQIEMGGLNVAPGTTLGDLTVVEMLQYLSAIFDAIDQVPSINYPLS